MEDLPVRLADFLETTAHRVRTLTVDRVAYWSKMAALGIVVATLGLVALIFLLIGIFRLLVSTGIGVMTTYAILAGLFLVVGMFFWLRRTRPPKDLA